MLPPDTNWLAIGQAVGLFLVGVITAYNSWKASRTAKVVDTIHTLTNSAMGAQKKTLAQVTAAKAAITHDPADLQAAVEAEADYIEHEKGQSVVDAAK